MKFTFSKQLFVFLIASMALNVFFTNCGVERPTVENMEFASVAMPHTGDEASCNDCHSRQRPINNLGFLGLNPDAPFDYTYHNSHLDCINCHNTIPNLTRIRADWARGYFMHKTTLTSCADCHSPQRPTRTANGQTHPTSGECSQCHASTLTGIANLPNSSYPNLNLSLWKNANGLPVDLVFSSARDINTTIQTPVYNPTTKLFSSWTLTSQKIHMYMNHSASLPGVTMSSCTTCHSDTSSYVGGKLHSSLSANSLSQPTNCSSCHNSNYNLSIPTLAASTSSFIGPASGANTTTNPSRFNHASTQGLGDCTSCHQQSSWSTPVWNKGFFHKTTSVPTTCSECHTPTRPSGLVGSSNMDHATQGMGECIGCHTSTKTALSTKTANSLNTSTQLKYSDWAGAVKTPTGVVGSETLNISSIKLISNAGAVTGKSSVTSQPLVLQFDHSAYQTSCSSCHTSASVFTGGTFHKNQTSQPTNCLSCHFTPLPGFILGYSSGKSLDHGHSTVNNKNCSSCHTAPTASLSSLVFKDGLYHTKLSSQPTTCKECHSPKVLDQPQWASMNHATIGSQDCKSCHNFPGTGVLGSSTNPPNWKGAAGGAPANISMSPPTGTSWGALNISHPAMVLSGINCSSCHGSASYSSRIVGYDHQNPPNGAKCVYCHYSGQNVVGVTVKTKSHEGASLNKDCNASGCHNSAKFSAFSFPSWNSSTRTWSGGRWK